MRLTLLLIYITAFIGLSAQDPYTDPDYEFYWQKGILEIPDSTLSYNFYDNTIYLDIFFADQDPNIGWACGYNSLILKTTDAGVNWKVIDLNERVKTDIQAFGSVRPAQFETIQFLNLDVGYVSGPIIQGSIRQEGIIYKSTDGGETWSEITPPGIKNNNGYSLWGFHFWDENRGVLLGQAPMFNNDCGNNIIYTTIDGGDTWNSRPLVYNSIKFSDPLFLDRNRLFFVGSSTIYEGDFDAIHFNRQEPNLFARTANSEDWQEEISIAGDVILLPGTSGCDGQDGLGSIRISTDWGENWELTPTQGTNYGSFMIDEQIGWIAGQVNGAYYTIDAGKTWNVVECGIDNPKDGDDIFFTDRTTGYLAANGVYKLRYAKMEERVQDTIVIDTCYGTSVTIGNINARGVTQWNTGQTSKTITVDEPGIYILNSQYTKTPSPQDPLCEGNDKWVYILQNGERPENNFTAIPDVSDYCVGDTVTIEFTGEAPFVRWLDDSSLDSIRSVTVSGDYIAESIDSEGCLFYDTLSITFRPLPEVDLTALTDLDVCVGYDAFIEATPGYDNYIWKLDGEDWSLAEGNVATITESGYYSVFVENEYSCGILSDSLYANVRLDSNRVILTQGDKFPYFGMVEDGEISCVEYYIKNNGTVPYTINDLYFLRNVEFTFPSSQLPVTLPVGDSIAITACYSPFAVHDSTDRDTLFIADQCEPHFIIAEGDPLIYGTVAETECDITLLMRQAESGTIRLFERILNLYPNPADEKIRLESILRNERELTQRGRFQIFDVNGQLVDVPVAVVIEATEIGGYYYSTVEIDVSGIANGVYYVRDLYGEIGNTFTIQR